MNEISKLERRIEELEGSCTKNKNHDITAVCIDFNGKMRKDEEVWEYPFNDEENKCVQCVCQVDILEELFKHLVNIFVSGSGYSMFTCPVLKKGKKCFIFRTIFLSGIMQY